MSTQGNEPVLRVAIVGCGKMGLNHARAINACAGAKLVAVADPTTDATRVASVLSADVRWFASAAEMLETIRPDVVHIATPPASHAELAILALNHGAHVYVEKPFTPTVAEAQAVFEVAQRAGRTVCAGHQLLFEAPARALARTLPIIGQVAHVESYFAFRPVRKAVDGRTLMSPVEQLLDILPHPVYTLLETLAAADSSPVEMCSLDVRPEGGVHALLRAGKVTAMLVVTLQGRPVESYLRVVGHNGALRADFVRGALINLAGAGSSAIALLSNPYREAKQVLIGSTKGFLARIRERKKGYPGLNELFEDFYHRVREGQPSPLSPASIVATVQICEEVGRVLRAAEEVREREAEADLRLREGTLAPIVNGKGVALVTGGSGLLGRAVVRELRAHGWHVRSLSRRVPAPSSREAGVEYAAADLGKDLPASLFSGVSTVVHCAAETAGGKEAHDRNTVLATRNVLRATAAAGVTRLLHISSIAVLKPSKVVGGPLTEQTPVDVDNLARGPYVWAKAEAEREVLATAPGLGVNVRVVRPGPLVNFEAYEPPGRLGRELGPVYLAIGPRNGRLSLCGVQTAALAIRAIVDDFDAAPALVNLVEPEAPTRSELMELWLKKRPDLKAIWMPSWVLATLSPMAKLAQKVLRPKATPIDVAAAFSSEQYDASVAAQVIGRAQARASEPPAADASLRTVAKAQPARAL